ncbi:HupE/UreJ family protein [Allohahella marinimesophila]|uniref:HupE/UreJ family protein n=1 Tax=Allohahella marinimesophila TaxID=1054972 RepID=A0ABP7NXY6_9GAMM
MTVFVCRNTLLSFIIALLIAAGALGASDTAKAHDLGMLKAELVETDTAAGSAYHLMVWITATPLQPAFQTPDLPSRCTMSEVRPDTVEGRQDFRFECESRLNSLDALILHWPIDGLLVQASWKDAPDSKALFATDNGEINLKLSALDVYSASTIAQVRSYFELGTGHILSGADHLFFVSGLLLLIASRRQLLAAITTFTAGHSVTLLITTLGYVHVPVKALEACIALSVVVMAFVAVQAQDGRAGLCTRYPWVVAGAFGLLHGFGFAGALTELELEASDLPLALLGFNLGVEAGQLIFIALALLVCGLALKVAPSFNRASSRRATAYTLGIVATYWTMQRTLLLV